MKHIHIPRWLLVLLLIVGSIALGFFFSRDAALVWDDPPLHGHSQWLLWKFHLIDSAPMPTDNGKWTGPLWALILGIGTELVFPWLKDPYLVRHALSWALLPLTLVATYLILLKAGIKRSTAFLAVAFLIGIIRYGGHALEAPRDFPHAAGFLLVTIGLFILFQRQTKITGRLLPVVLGAVSVIPFLLRSPNGLHFALLLAFLGSIGISVGGKPPRRIVPVLLALLGGLGVVFLLSPVLWEQGFTDPLHPLKLFARFPHQDVLPIFGVDFTPQTQPWWFPFAWILIMTHPAVLLASIPGLYFFIRSPSPEGATKKKMIVTLKEWLLTVTLMTWGTTLALHPHVYSEDRHLLFLYPPLFLMAALGFDRLKDRWKFALAAAVIILSAFSYARWGRYAYIYKSPLIGNTHADHFLGDHRAMCLPEAVDALQGRVPADVPVWIHTGPRENATAQERRRQESRIAGLQNFVPHIFAGSEPRKTPYAVIGYNTSGRVEAIQADIEAGNATLLWKSMMAPGDTACIIAMYHE